MQRTLFLALTMVSFLMACAPAAKPVSHPTHTIEKEVPTADQALQTLSAAEVYGAWAIGYGGLPSAEAAALEVLVADPDGARLLQLVIDNGTLPGQLMALTGLQQIDPQAFSTAFERYPAMNDVVRVRADGCLIHHEEVAANDLAQRIADGEYVYSLRR